MLLVQDFDVSINGAVTSIAWMSQDVFITGHTDGSIHVYRMIEQEDPAEGSEACILDHVGIFAC